MAAPRDPFWKEALLVFAACVVLYAAGFAAVQRWRARGGPWEVTFRVEARGTPVLEISQRRLGIADVTLRFTATNLPPDPAGTRVRFDEPAQRDRLPFGRVEFLDTTFLPGTVTLELFGHQVELLPRVLTVDKLERPWRSSDTWEISDRAGGVQAQPPPPGGGTPEAARLPGQPARSQPSGAGLNGGSGGRR